MFSLLLLIPTVYMHSTAQVSQMNIVFPQERQKNKETLHMHFFQYRSKSVIYQHLKKYYQNNYH